MKYYVLVDKNGIVKATPAQDGMRFCSTSGFTTFMLTDPEDAINLSKRINGCSVVEITLDEFSVNQFGELEERKGEK